LAKVNLNDIYIRHLLNNSQSPNFYAYFPANFSFPGFLGDMLCGGFDVIGFSWVLVFLYCFVLFRYNSYNCQICSPACTELETIVMDWLAKMINLPDFYHSSKKGGGVIQGTASEANIVALLASVAQKKKESKSDGVKYRQNLVAYASDQVKKQTNILFHSKIIKIICMYIYLLTLIRRTHPCKRHA
jgi:aromatic-L-amino-acid/L-tryptophan decarboxylase